MKFLSFSLLFLMAAITLNAQSYKVTSDATTLHWTGQKVSGTHEGFIKVKEGDLKLENGNLSGRFTIDMTSMTCTDIQDAEYNKNLIGHLMAADFFNVAENPMAEFKIKEAKKVYRSNATHDITGDLTIKGITKEITIPANVEANTDGFSATAKFSIDRTRWDIKYGSGGFFEGLGDKMIYDDILFDLKLTAQPQK